MAPEAAAPPTRRVEDLVVFRYSNYDTPFWARPNTRPGRWHLTEHGPTQYLSLTSDGAWAELIRHEGLREEADVAEVHMTLWSATVNQSMVVDYGSFAGAEAAGFPPDALVDDDHGRCRAEGLRLRELGYHGVLAPSAALPGELNLTLFGARVAASWRTAPALASFVPARIVTTGAPPPGLVARVRHRGRRHSGLAEHLARAS